MQLELREIWGETYAMSNDNGRRLWKFAASRIEPAAESEAVKGFKFYVSPFGRAFAVRFLNVCVGHFGVPLED